MSFSVNVDARNPGQFFACCGLLELAARLSGVATGRFAGDTFVLEAACTFTELLGRWTTTPLIQVNLDDDSASPIRFAAPFDLLLDWWLDEASGGQRLKVWAGKMQNVRILRAMMGALQTIDHTPDLLNSGCVVVGEDEKKVEPFCFDARRSGSALPRDAGFSTNDLKITTVAMPAVEALCLVGLQRFRPRPVAEKFFSYHTWNSPLPCSIASAACCGLARFTPGHRYVFETAFRSEYMKTFRPAALIEQEGE